MFKIGKPVLVFQTRMGKILGKLRFRQTEPYWIMREFKGSYQLGIVAEEVVEKWVNNFRLKPYYEPMPQNPFKQRDAEAKTGSCKRIAGNQDEPTTNPVLPETRDKE